MDSIELERLKILKFVAQKTKIRDAVQQKVNFFKFILYQYWKTFFRYKFDLKVF